jgi:hypothetical protein
MSNAFTADDYVRMVKIEFPADPYSELASDLVESDGLLHLQVSALARLAREAKRTADWGTYRRIMRLADSLWRNPDHQLLNALNVSFLEHIDFEGPNGAHAWQLLSPELQIGWRAMQAYLEKIALHCNPSLRQAKDKNRKRRKRK